MHSSNFSDFTDEALILLYQTIRDRQIEGVLYHRHFQDIFNYCFHILKNRDDAFDQTQEVFIKGFNKITQLKKPDNFGAWLRRITYRNCLNFLKNRKNRLKATSEFWRWNQQGIEEEDIAFREQLLNRMEQTLQELPAATSQILHLKYLDEKSIIELHNLLNISESAVKMRLSRARFRMKKQFNNKAVA